MKSPNSEIRAKAKMHDVKMWQIAKSLKISEAQFYRYLRKDLSADEKEKVLAVIDQLKEE